MPYSLDTDQTMKTKPGQMNHEIGDQGKIKPVRQAFSRKYLKKGPTKIKFNMV